MRAENPDVPPEVLTELRSVCRRLPQAQEEPAWVGVRWRIRTRTFAHVLTVESGWPPAYARAAADDGPVTLLTFRSWGEELEALRAMGRPFFAPVWRADEVGMVLGDAVDWQEVAELVAESYRLQAPKALGELIDRPTE